MFFFWEANPAQSRCFIFHTAADVKTVEPPSSLCRPELFHSMSFVHSRRDTTVIALTLQPGAYTDNSCLTWIPCTRTPGCQSMSVHCFMTQIQGFSCVFPNVNTVAVSTIFYFHHVTGFSWMSVDSSSHSLLDGFAVVKLQIGHKEPS